MKKTILKTLVLLSLLAACATVGKPFDTTHVQDIRNGEQNKAQIEAWFGTPHQKVMPLQGSPLGCVERWQWTHAESVAGGKTTSKSLVVDFDAKGVVCDNGYSETAQ